jgi:hypothetical protein
MTKFLALCSVVVILAGRLFHILVAPHWTEAQALVNLWVFWVTGFLLAALAALTSRTESHGNKRHKGPRVD